MALKLHPFVVSLATTSIPCSLVHRRRPRKFFSSFSWQAASDHRPQSFPFLLNNTFGLLMSCRMWEKQGLLFCYTRKYRFSSGPLRSFGGGHKKVDLPLMRSLVSGRSVNSWATNLKGDSHNEKGSLTIAAVQCVLLVNLHPFRSYSL